MLLRTTSVPGALVLGLANVLYFGKLSPIWRTKQKPRQRDLGSQNATKIHCSLKPARLPLVKLIRWSLWRTRFADFLKGFCEKENKKKLLAISNKSIKLDTRLQNDFFTLLSSSQDLRRVIGGQRRY